MLILRNPVNPVWSSSRSAGVPSRGIIDLRNFEPTVIFNLFPRIISPLTRGRLPMRFRLILLIVISGLLSYAHGQTGRSPSLGSGQRWAVVIGISQYKFLPAEQQLKYATNDAESFAAFLRTHEGGDFDDDHLKVLLNDNATSRNIRSALGTWLPSKVVDSDTVIIYYVGQGAFEESQGGAYLAPYDAEPQDLYATAVAVDSISLLLQRRIPARQIIVIADANHAGHLGRSGAEDKGVVYNQVNMAINRLAVDRTGVYAITANRPGEPSMESAQYGGGHGVFTHYLLQALKGGADSNSDSVIRADETFEFVQGAVTRETEGTQHPQQTGRFGNRVALAITPVPGRAADSTIASGGETSSDKRASDTASTASESRNTGASTTTRNRNTRRSGDETEASNTKPKSDSEPPRSSERNTPKKETPPVDTAPALSPAMINFNNAMERGSLLEPRGRSAWDSYLDMVKGDPNKPELAPVKTRLSDALAAEGQTIIDKQMDPVNFDVTLVEYQKASAVFAKAYQLRPDNPKLNTLQQVSEGRALTLLQRYEEAQKTLQKATDLDPESALAHMALGIAFREQQRYFLAERELKRAIELQGDWFLPHLNLGLTYEAGKSEDDAIKEYTAALSLNDKSPVVYARLGLLYLSQKKYSAAAAALEKSVAMKPDSDLYNKLGNAYFGMGKQEEASKAYRMARETRTTKP